MPTRAKVYVWGIIAAGVAMAIASLPFSHWGAPLPFLIYLCVVVGGAAIKLRLPGLTGTYSASFMAILFGLTDHTFAEMMLAAAVVGLAQSVLNVKKRPLPIQIAFNMANMILSIALCFGFMQGARGFAGNFQPALFCGAAVVYFAVNTVIVSGVLSLLEGKGLGSVWESWYLWSFAYYLVGSAVLGVLLTSMRSAEGWLVLIPLIYLIHFYYGLSVRPDGKAGASAQTETGANNLPRAAHMFILTVVLAGFTLLTWSVLNWTSRSGSRFGCVLVLALIASTCKIRLPRMTGTMSILFVILLFGIAQLSLSEMLVISAFSAVVQCLWKARRRPAAIQVLFNMASLVLSTAMAVGAFRMAGFLFNGPALSASLVVATLILYGVNTVLLAAVLCIIESKPLARLWQNCCFWSLPFYMVGTVVSGLMIAASRDLNWAAPLMILTMMGLIYVSYRAQVRHAVETPVLA